jgi:cystathionine beta-lyase
VLDGGGEKEAHAFLDALDIFGLGYSWGGYESLAVAVFLGDRALKKAYEGPVIRLQIGLEDVDDLTADISRGLKAARG